MFSHPKTSPAQKVGIGVALLVEALGKPHGTRAVYSKQEDL
jgi:hypothetical protein